MDGLAFLMGGWDRNSTLDTVECYNLRTGESKMMPPLKTKRHHACAVEMEGMAFLMGGWHGSSTLDTVECYNLRTGKSRMMPGLTMKRRNACAVKTDGKAYVLGGAGQDASSFLRIPFETDSDDDFDDTVDPCRKAYSFLDNVECADIIATRSSFLRSGALKAVLTSSEEGMVLRVYETASGKLLFKAVGATAAQMTLRDLRTAELTFEEVEVADNGFVESVIVVSSQGSAVSVFCCPKNALPAGRSQIAELRAANEAKDAEITALKTTIQKLVTRPAVVAQYQRTMLQLPSSATELPAYRRMQERAARLIAARDEITRTSARADDGDAVVSELTALSEAPRGDMTPELRRKTLELADEAERQLELLRQTPAALEGIGATAADELSVLPMASDRPLPVLDSVEALDAKISGILQRGTQDLKAAATAVANIYLGLASGRKPRDAWRH
jgi:hypothetical protein